MHRQLALAAMTVGLVPSRRSAPAGRPVLAERLQRAARAIEDNFRGIVRCTAELDAAGRSVHVRASGHDPYDERDLLRHLRAAWAAELNDGTGPRLRVVVEAERPPTGA